MLILEVPYKPLNLQQDLKSDKDYDSLVRDRYLLVSDKARAICKLHLMCRRCPYSMSLSNNMAPLLNRNSKVVFIGRSPSAFEKEAGQIVSPITVVGSLFDRYLTQLGLSRSEVSVLNMCSCHVKYFPTWTRVLRCASIKRYEFEYIDSYKVVFLMCNDAMKWFYGWNNPGVMSSIGSVYRTIIPKGVLWNSEDREVLVVPMLHPSSLILNREYTTSVSKILSEVRELIKSY